MVRGWAVLVAAAAFAQSPPPAGFVSGTLLDWDSFGRSGELSLRARDNHVYVFVFDNHTYFEADQKPVWVSDLKPGDRINILCDAGTGGSKRYARTVTAVPGDSPPRFPAYRARYPSGITDDLFPRGNLTFSGIVSRVDTEHLVIRLYPTGRKDILLRDDTRYLDGGTQVDASALKVNTRIFVRAGENLYGEVEAYQVMWGDILKPR